jgi:hypothetical protein
VKHLYLGIEAGAPTDIKTDTARGEREYTANGNWYRSRRNTFVLEKR